MKQVKVGLDESHVKMLGQFKRCGFKDKSEMVRFALDLYVKDMANRRLRESAALYAQVYEEDAETREWMKANTAEWPS